MTVFSHYIASYDDLVEFCGTDEVIAERHFDTFAVKEDRKVTFDPYISAASN
jgi:hypothetical protein